MPKTIIRYMDADEVPYGAVYLSTQVEKQVHYDYGINNTAIVRTTEALYLTYHYFLVDTSPVATLNPAVVA